MEIEVEIYKAPSGERPFETWIKSIREIHTRAKILTRIDRLKMGNFGDCKTLQGGIGELRIDYGPGIRIYYGKIGNKLILLLCGGDKRSQEKDIATAKKYLKDFQSRKENHGKK